MNKKYGKNLLVVMLILILFGIVMIYSSSSIWANYKFNDSFKYVKHQILFFSVGIFILYLVSRINYKLYFKYSTHIFIVCLILLVLVLIPGIGNIRNGSRSWFGIGQFGIQPSEFAKISLIIFTSKYLCKSNKYISNIKQGILPILLILFLTFGLIMLQPDFGTGMIIVISILFLLYVSGVSIKFFLGLGAVGLIGIIILIAIAPYRINRITSFLNPWNDPLGTGFQIIQSLYAIGPGEFNQMR